MSLFYAPPWFLLAALAAVGLVVAWTGISQANGRTRTVGLALLGLAVVWFGVRFVVESDADKVRRLNAELIQSVPAQDWSKFASLLQPDATLGTVGASQFGNRDLIVQGAKADVGRWGLRSVSVTHTEVTQDPGGIIVNVTVASKQDTTEGFFPFVNSDWRMIWTRSGKDWRCHSITCLGIGQEKSDTVGRYLK